MMSNRAQQPGRSDRSESPDKSGELVMPNSHQGAFPVQDTMPMQPPSYHYMNLQQQHMPTMSQVPHPYAFGPQMGDGSFGGVPISGGMNASMGPSPAPGGISQSQAPINPLMRPMQSQSPLRGPAAGAVAPHYEAMDQNAVMPPYYSRISPNQLYEGHDSNGVPYSTSVATPGSKTRTPAGTRNIPSSAGYEAQYAADFLNQVYQGGPQASPYASAGACDENVENPKSQRVEEIPTKQFIAKQYPMISALKFQYMRKYQSDQAMLRLHELVDAINISGSKMTDFGYWKRLTNSMFTPRASVRHTKKLGADYRFFEIAVPMMPIMHVSLTSINVQRIEVAISQLKVEVLSNGSIFFHTPALTFSYHYTDGSYITHHSQLKGSFNSALKIEWLDIFVYKFSPGIEWNSLERILAKPTTGVRKLGNSVDESGNDQTPQGNKSDTVADQQRNNKDEMRELRSKVSAFKSISDQGLHDGILRVFQVSDVMSALTELCIFQKDQNIKSPLEALSSFVRENRDGSLSNPAAEGVHEILTSDDNNIHKAKSGTNREEHSNLGSNSPACSPRDVRGGKPTINETGPQIKRRRSNKAASRMPKTSSSASPTSESFDCNGIPGTKKIKF